MMKFKMNVSFKKSFIFCLGYVLLLFLYIGVCGAVVPPNGIVDKPDMIAMYLSYVFLVSWIITAVLAGRKNEVGLLLGAMVVSIMPILSLLEVMFLRGYFHFYISDILLLGGCFWQGIVTNGHYSTKLHQILIFQQPLIFLFGYYLSWTINRKRINTIA